MLRVESGLFFANADHVREAVEGHASEEGVHAVVLDAQTVPFVDVTASRMLEELGESLSVRGIALFLARDVGQVRDVLRRARPDDDTDQGLTFATVEEAVEAASRATSAQRRTR